MTDNSSTQTFNLKDVARQVMIARDFIPDFSPQIMEELSKIQLPISPSVPIRDMRECLWVSIDNADTFDLDQLTFAQKGSSGQDKIFIAVADVDAVVFQNTEIDKQAAHNTTSVYTPFQIFPMLPVELSTNLTSLKDQSERHAVVIEIDVNAEGEFNLSEIYLALVYNHAKLSYNDVAAWLDKKTSTPYPFKDIPQLPEQLKLQDSLAHRIRTFRLRQGALSFGLTEIEPIVVNGVAIKLEKVVHNRANVLIENFMIAANSVVTSYLISKDIPVIQRVVKAPKRWDRIVELAAQYNEQLPSEPDAKALQVFLLKRRQIDQAAYPELSLAIIKLIGKGEYIVALPGRPSLGHFDLAQSHYAHTTAPNRRYVDLVMQRLLKAFIYSQKQPYSEDQLFQIAQHCTQKEDDAAKVERRMKKSAAAMVLSSQIGNDYPAIVTGANEKDVWVRLLTLPIEGKLIQGFQGVDVGDHLEVKLINVDIKNGFIDFARQTSDLSSV